MLKINEPKFIFRVFQADAKWAEKRTASEILSS